MDPIHQGSIHRQRQSIQDASNNNNDNLSRMPTTTTIVQSNTKKYETHESINNPDDPVNPQEEQSTKDNNQETVRILIQQDTIQQIHRSSRPYKDQKDQSRLQNIGDISANTSEPNTKNMIPKQPEIRTEKNPTPEIITLFIFYSNCY